MLSLITGTLIFAPWAVLSVMAAFPRLERHIRARDCFRLIPQWRFFAPSPSMTDYFVVYRDVLDNGAVTKWTELRRIRRSWWNALIYPTKRDRKSELDAAIQLARFERGRPFNEVLSSIPYLAILNRVTCVERWVEPQFTQFAVAAINLGMEEPDMRIFLISGLHPLR